MKILRLVPGLLLAAALAPAQVYQISTIAGTGTVQGYFGDTDPAIYGQLNYPLRVTLDNQGNIYVADFYNFVIRQVANTGTMNTFAGTGTEGFAGDGGPATTTPTLISSAEIALVFGLATDASRNLYIADPVNRRVRRVTAGGLLTTFAGNGTLGNTGDGGPATAAELIQPYGVAVDSSNNVYIADIGSYTIRKVDGQKGTISTFAGTGTYGYSGDGGPASAATFGSPYALAFDPAGNLYVSDPSNRNIRKITPCGTISTVATGVDAESIAVDAGGNIYYPNYQNNTVQKILPGGTQVTIAGNGTAGFAGDGGPANFAELNSPYGVALDAAGNVYVADSGNMVIRKLTQSCTVCLAGIANAATNQNSTIAPGEIVVIYGSGLGPATLTSAPGGYYGTELAGTIVQFNGLNSPIIYTSSTQVAVVVPYGVPPASTVPLAVFYNGASSGPANVAVWLYAPGIFSLNATGSGPAAAINQNGTVNSTSNPAALGSYISLYTTGGGQVSPTPIDGTVAPSSLSAIPKPVQPVSVTVGGQSALVTYAGGAPGEVNGLMQVNIQIPTSLTSQVAKGSVVSLPVVLQVGTYTSPATVTIAVTVQ